MTRAVLLLLALFSTTAAFGQVDCNRGLEPIDHKAESRMTAMDFINDVAANELAFARAFTGFNYTLQVEFKTLQDNQVDGEFRQVSKLVHDSRTGRHRVTTVGEPVNTLKRATPRNSDIDALREALAITPQVLADRDIVYSGRQRLADFNAVVFDILPRNRQATQRAFMGRVWVRMRDNAIARICGRVPGGPFGPMRYLVERTKVEDKYWFPTAIRADENVRVDDSDVHVRVDVTYSDFTPR